MCDKKFMCKKIENNDSKFNDNLFIIHIYYKLTREKSIML